VSEPTTLDPLGVIAADAGIRIAPTAPGAGSPPEPGWRRRDLGFA